MEIHVFAWDNQKRFSVKAVNRIPRLMSRICTFVFVENERLD